MKKWRTPMGDIAEKAKQFAQRRHAIERLETRLMLASQAYNWSDANIGAGGFLDGVFFDPHNVGVMYARTDIGGLYKTTNGGDNWQPLLDFVGNDFGGSGTNNGTYGGDMQVLGFTIDPENSNNLYALVGDTTGAVLYSTNAGASWTIDNTSFTESGNGTDRAAGERIAVDPHNSNIVLAGSNLANGLYISTNAGHSFTQSSSFPTTSPISFILFDPYGGTQGSATQTILVGQTSNSSGSNIYETTDGGTSWTQLANTNGPASYYPMRAAFDSADDGNVYFAFSNGLLPDVSTASAGGIWRYNLNSNVWASIAPSLPSGPPAAAYAGLGVDPENPGTLVVTTFDHYNGGDFIMRTTNANAASPTWVSLFGGYNTRNTTSSPWISTFTDWIGNWAATAAIDPFNPAHIVYGTGQGLWTTLTGNSNTTLTAANSWYFKDYGIDFTAVINLNSAPSGVPLFSGIGDINGFAHTTLTSSPSQGAIVPGGSIGNMTGVDSAWTNTNYVAAVGPTGTNAGGYSLNDGQTWTEFASKPSGASGGTVAVTMNAAGTGMTIVWSPSSKAVYYSSDNGSSWTASTGGMATGGKVIADRLTPGDFYYYVGSRLWFSSNYGVSFTSETSSAPSGAAIAVNPFVTGDLWMAQSGGVYHSSNFGATWARVGPLTSTDSRIALGAPAPGQTVPAIYIRANIGGFLGFDRSDDGGLTWVTINDVNHQWGGYPTYDNGGAFGLMAADPKVFGRVYLATNGRGVIVGNPTSSLPAGWSDVDVNTPGNPGWATSNTTLSNGSTVSQWTVNGGGAGIGSSSDQLNFASQAISGNALVSADVVSMTNADGANGTPMSGVMIRGGNGPNDPFAAMTLSATGIVQFEYRATSGAAVSTLQLAGAAFSTEYLEVVRNANNSFSGYYSSDGTTWLQLGPAVALYGMPASANAGLMATAGYNAQLTSATFGAVRVIPLSFSDTSGNNTYAIDLKSGDPSTLQVFVNTPETGIPTYSFPIAQVPSLSFTTGTGDDSLTVDFTNGDPVPSGGVSFTDGGGNETLNVVAPTGNNSATLDANDVVFDGSTISYTGPIVLSITTGSGNDTVTQAAQPGARVNFTGGTGNDTLNVNSGEYVFEGDPQASTSSLTVNDNSSVVFSAGPSGIQQLHLASLNIASGANAGLITAPLFENRSLLIVGALGISGTGVLDLGGNDMIAQSGNEGTIFNDLHAGFNLGTWDGPGGIDSYKAAGDTTHLTTLGERVSDGSSFDGVTPTVGNILVKYTLYGDADLSGSVDGADYQQIDSGYGSTASGWSNGDFNYDGAVDGSDYSLIDNAFNESNAGAAPLAVVAKAIGTNAIAATSAFAVTPIATSQSSALVIENAWAGLDKKGGPFLLQ